MVRLTKPSVGILREEREEKRKEDEKRKNEREQMKRDERRESDTY
jgi:hypothetical protein